MGAVEGIVVTNKRAKATDPDSDSDSDSDSECESGPEPKPKPKPKPSNTQKINADQNKSHQERKPKLDLRFTNRSPNLLGTLSTERSKHREMM